MWVTLHEALDERALYAEAIRAGVTFLPGGALQAEKSSRTSMRLSFSMVAPEAHDEAVRRLAQALRAVRRRGRERNGRAVLTLTWVVRPFEYGALCHRYEPR